MKNETTIIKELKERHVFVDMTGDNGLEELLEKEKKLVVYCGFDPTADSLHVGSLLPLVNMKRFIDHGHKVIALVGGATGLIGDPSFKDSERGLNSVEKVEEFKAGIRKQIVSILGEEVLVVDNLEWTQNMDVITFLRDIGKHFTVNKMIAKESVKQRIGREGSGLSFTEFSYQLLQGMDFLKLKEKFGCNLQIGGSDQMGNITAGTSLIHRVMGHEEAAFGLTTKLLTKSDGTKFGKSESGTVWLDPKKTSPFDFFQFWLKTTDEDVYNFLNFFSKMTPNKIEELKEEDKNRRPEAQSILAKEMTLMVHGEEGLQEALLVTNAMVSGDFSGLEPKMLENVVAGLDTVTLEEGIELPIALVESGLATSRKKAREFINKNAISINGEKISDQDLKLTFDHSVHNKFIFLKRGKRNMATIILSK